MQFGRLKLDRCRHGWMLHRGPFIGKCFELYGQYSEAEVDVFRLFLRPGHTAVDVGANIGDLTVPMAQIVGPEGRIWAIESHHTAFQVLNANLALNGIEHVQAIKAFVSDLPSPEMGGIWGEHGFVSATWKPPALRLDDLRLGACALIKVDVDGRELAVLRSAEQTIQTHRPILYFENDVREQSPELLGYVAGLGYALYFHAAPMFSPDNFFGNPVNHWAPENMASLMMIGVPEERADTIKFNLLRMQSPEDWWPGL